METRIAGIASYSGVVFVVDYAKGAPSKVNLVLLPTLIMYFKKMPSIEKCPLFYFFMTFLKDHGIN